jgi:hypothetical protein
MIRVCLVFVAALVTAASAQEHSEKTFPTIDPSPEPTATDACQQDFARLGSDVEKLELLYSSAHDHHDTDLSCKLLDKLVAAEERMVILFQAKWPACADDLKTLTMKSATIKRIRADECGDEPSRFFTLKEYKPGRSNLVGDFPRLPPR